MMDLVRFVAGLAALVVGAELLVRGASRLATSFGISPLVVGLTIVAFGTSAPEIAVSVSAVLDGKGDLAIGNVVGSNIFNLLFILGVSALITPLSVHRQLIRQDAPLMLGSSLLLMLLVLDGGLSVRDGLLLFALFLGYTVFLIVQSRRQGAEQQAAAPSEGQAATPGGGGGSTWVQLALILVGLAGLVVGSDWLVEASVSFAKALGVSDLVIGLTIVAAGTSLPEVATSVMAAFKGERDIAVGNAVGSCTFNILACLGLAGLVSGAAGLPVAPSVLGFDIWVMLGVAMASLPVFVTGREIARWEGGLFLLYYVAYVSYLILTAQGSTWLPSYDRVMLGYVVPLTVVTLMISLLRRRTPE